MLQRMEAERQVCTDVETTSLKEGLKQSSVRATLTMIVTGLRALLYPYKVQIGEMLDKGSIMRLSRCSMRSLKACRTILLRMSIIATLMICTVLTIPAETCLMLSSGR